MTNTVAISGDLTDTVFLSHEFPSICGLGWVATVASAQWQLEIHHRNALIDKR